jgi:hypothetical protein
MKVCSKCGQEKSLYCFYRDKSKKNGLCPSCKVCCNKQKANYIPDPDKIRENARKYYHRNKEERRKLRMEYYYDNLENQRAYAREYRKGYYEANKNTILKKGVYYTAQYRADRQDRTPSWVDLRVIKEFYLSCPEGYHVDHIVPLRGKNVSGLHVLENLQYLLAEDNMSKGNKF